MHVVLEQGGSARERTFDAEAVGSGLALAVTVRREPEEDRGFRLAVLGRRSVGRGGSRRGGAEIQRAFAGNGRKRRARAVERRVLGSDARGEEGEGAGAEGFADRDECLLELTRVILEIERHGVDAEDRVLRSPRDGRKTQ